MSEDVETAAAEASIDAPVIERAAAATDATAGAVADALVVLHAELLGRHSNLEAERPYVTVDGRRAYRVDPGVWEEFLAEFDLGAEAAAAARRAHTDQAERLFAAADEDVDDDFGPGAEGVVVGIDTAERF